jgi:hypothetical protein
MAGSRRGGRGPHAIALSLRARRGRSGCSRRDVSGCSASVKMIRVSSCVPASCLRRRRQGAGAAAPSLRDSLASRPPSRRRESTLTFAPSTHRSTWLPAVLKATKIFWIFCGGAGHLFVPCRVFDFLCVNSLDRLSALFPAASRSSSRRARCAGYAARWCAPAKPWTTGSLLRAPTCFRRRCVAETDAAAYISVQLFLYCHASHILPPARMFSAIAAAAAAARCFRHLAAPPSVAYGAII